MANIKIGDLVTLSDPISTDVLPIVDVSADTTNKISIEELLKNAAAGTEAAPAFAFDADPNTGMYRSGADALAFSTGGTGRLFIDSSGNVGIGGSPTNTASTKTFEIIDSVTPRALFKCTGTGGRQYGWYTSTDGQFAVYDYTAGSERMRIKSDGTFYVNNPEANSYHNGVMLDPLGKVAAYTNDGVSGSDQRIYIYNGDTSSYKASINSDGGAFFGGDVGIGTATPGEALDVNGTVKIGNTKLYSSGSGGTFDLRFQTYSGGFFDRVTITGAGEVGIGTTSPGALLDIQDTGSATTALIAYTNDTATQPIAKFRSYDNGLGSATDRMVILSSGSVGIGTSSPGIFNSLANQLVVSNDGTCGITIDATSTTSSRIHFADGTTGDESYRGIIEYAHNSDAFFLSTAATTALTIDSDGKLGIGTTSPATLLHVSSDDFIRLTRSSKNLDINANYSANNVKAQIQTDTGMALAFATNGDNERMRIDSSGNVGIATTTPASAYKLDVAGAARFSGGNGYVSFGDNGYIRTDESGWLRFQSGTNGIQFMHSGNTTERMRIDSSGDVSIGTTSILTQTAEFRVYSSGVCAQELAASDGTYTCYSSGPNSTSVVGRGFVGSANQLITSGSVSDFAIRAQSALVFASNGSTERMRIDSSGHVGIGTTSPDTDLHVSSSTSTLTKFQNTLSTSVYLRFQNTDNARGYVGYEGKRLVFYADNGSNTGDKRVAFMDADGLKFNSDTAQVNALNDYEEGTFVPAINRDTTSPTVAYNWQTGKYTKIGNMVLIYFDLEVSSNSGGSGRYFIDNLPFDTATGNTSGGYGSPQFRDSGAFNNDANKFSTSSYHYLDTIQLRYMDMASTNNEVDITVGTGRITGWSMYFTDS